MKNNSKFISVLVLALTFGLTACKKKFTQEDVDSSFDNGYTTGYGDGYDDGYDDGHEDGFQEAKNCYNP